ncbi:hypothetical protein P375_05990 [Gallibacterium genomosp. 2]|uniref:Uncharacterized protein n=2 Tax=Gallibacterium TaxID=155493 RepID=F4HBX8_GALAU|nr:MULTISPECIES: hypothetical protein [Gallibacterium]AEC16405.1 hypothetical protein UMN179_00368 [Gallibacterium anatis UMN179]KGQ32342.1 hypothetical protein P375_05990 [Gallibacterium genomosp. 2]KGQ42028.1 hypothetical protein JP30_02650 [Gallibacterium anatis IPDH697-78]MBP4132431.1 hypothetical protein [Gallibacterium anatis]
MNTQQLINYIWKNRNKKYLFYYVVNNIARSGKSRKARIYVLKDNELLEVTKVIASVNNAKIDGDNLVIIGSGMDMYFYTLHKFLSRISKAKNLSKDGEFFLSADSYIHL